MEETLLQDELLKFIKEDIKVNTRKRYAKRLRERLTKDYPNEEFYVRREGTGGHYFCNELQVANIRSKLHNYSYEWLKPEIYENNDFEAEMVQQQVDNKNRKRTRNQMHQNNTPSPPKNYKRNNVCFIPILFKSCILIFISEYLTIHATE